VFCSVLLPGITQLREGNLVVYIRGDGVACASCWLHASLHNWRLEAFVLGLATLKLLRQSACLFFASQWDIFPLVDDWAFALVNECA